MSKVELYTWSTCPYCIGAKKLLDKEGIAYSETVIDGNNEKKQELYRQTGQNTVPFIFINDNFIGGYSELRTFISNGKLKTSC